MNRHCHVRNNANSPFNIYFQYADPTDEPASQPYDQSFEDFDLSVEEWKGN